jgi:hypothetical protein
VRHLTQLLIDYERWRFLSRRCASQARHDFIEHCMEHEDRHLHNPLLKVSLVYWTCHFALPLELLLNIGSLR